ncbi:MAG: hypothetical protein ABFS19_03575 [Thermodesulfobacteriota bacterium]
MKPRSGVSLCLHIGMPKTGTTAVQHFLAYNRQPLSDSGILYPECGIPDFQHAAFVKSIVARHYPWTVCNNGTEHIEPKNYLNSVIDQCRERKCSRVIMSSEFFWAAPAMQSGPPYHRVTEKNLSHLDDFVCRCRELFQLFEKVQIVVYLRRQDGWLDSFFGQQVKEGFNSPDEKIIRTPRIYLLYAENLKIWAREFGRENIAVRIYDEQTGDVVGDFCRTVEIDASRYQRPKRESLTVNNRLTTLAADIMKNASKLTVDSRLMERMKRILMETSYVLIRQQQAGVQLFSRDLLADALRLYSEENRKLAAMFPEAERLLDTTPLASAVEEGSQTQCLEHDTQQLIADLVNLAAREK